MKRQKQEKRIPEIAERDRETRNALTTQLHQLQNALFAAAMQIEVASIEKSCPEEFRETLEKVGSQISEAMEIASRANTLIVSNPASILADPRTTNS